ncbi:MAG: M20/M25/M40 family metallo-hydrolase [Deltaproteobacteria bacterium]|nr:M20/M25/M40 family metallo-hydrolase [Deltaproteobacteria bacterium]
METSKNLELALKYLNKNFDRFVEELSDYAKIPSVSAKGFPPETLEASAQWTAKRMEQSGLENVEILRVKKAPPYIYGDWLHAKDAPTLLLYAHHDVQPPGRPQKWLSKPFEPQVRQGRLYGRGVVDDKAGGMMHLAALEAVLKTSGKLPLNIKFIVEGEEETGSHHLSEFLKKYQKQLQSDVMILTDTANLQEGTPSITYSLRGIVDACIEVRTLDHPVHSGMWGGPGRDALSVLIEILARLWKANGQIAIEGIYQDILPPSQEEKKALASLPFKEESFRQQLGLVPSMAFSGEKDYSVYERIWTRPTLSVLAIDAPRIQETTNQLVEWAQAKVSMRIVHGMDPQKSLKQLCDFLAKDPPLGAQVTVHPGAAGEAWHTKPQGPAFEAAQRALKKGYGQEAVLIGCGGSIPFVRPLTEAFGGIPALLIGLEDPLCQAHGENESLSLSDWKKGMDSAVHLYFEKFV